MRQTTLVPQIKKLLQKTSKRVREYKLNFFFWFGPKFKLAPLTAFISTAAILDLAVVSLIGPVLITVMDKGKQENAIVRIREVFGNLPEQLNIHLNENFAEFAIGFLLIFYIVRTLFSYTANYKIIKFSNYRRSKMSSLIFNTLLNLPDNIYQKINEKEQINVMSTEINYFGSHVITPLLVIISEALVFFVICLFLLLVYPTQFLFILAYVTSFGIVFYVASSKPLKHYGHNMSSSEQIRIGYTIDSLRCYDEIALLKNPNEIQERYSRLAQTVAINLNRLGKINLTPRYFLELSAMTGLCISLGWLIANNKPESMAMVVTIGLAAFRLLPSLSRINTNLVNLKFGLSAIQKLMSFYQKHILNRDEICRRYKNFFITNDPSSGVAVSLENLNLRLGEKRILSDTNLEITKGDWIVLKGASGTGKTSFLKALMGFKVDESQRGKISIFSEFKTPNEIFSYVPQNLFLISGSIEENIVFFNDDTDCAKIERCICQVELDFLLGSRLDVKNLSGGQKQRLGIARGIYKESEIFVLDEPTSALNPEMRDKVLQNLRTYLASKTVIMVTHDPKLETIADKVYELRDTKLVEIAHE